MSPFFGLLDLFLNPNELSKVAQIAKNRQSDQEKKRKEEAYPWKAGASSGHTTNLKQSILRILIYMVETCLNSKQTLGI